MENTQNEVEISLADLIFIIVKHVKLWVTFLIIGGLITAGLAVLQQPQYEYQQSFKAPHASGDPIIPTSDFNQLLNGLVYDFKQNPQMIQGLATSGVQTSELTDKSSETFQLTTTQVGLDQTKAVKALFNHFIEQLQKQSGYQQALKHWQQQLDQQIDQAKQIIETVKKQADTTVDPELYQQQGHLLNQKASAVLKIQPRSSVQQSLKPVNWSWQLVVIIGLMVTLFMATIFVWLIHWVGNIAREIQAKLKQNS